MSDNTGRVEHLDLTPHKSGVKRGPRSLAEYVPIQSIWLWRLCFTMSRLSFGEADSAFKVFSKRRLYQ
jgi:hypothetical protein